MIKQIKSYLSQFTMLRRFYRKHIKRDPEEFYVFERQVCAGSDLDSVTQILNLLNYSKTATPPYAAKTYPAGYHTISLGGHELRGRRNPAERFSYIPVDFNGKTVLDVGCNQGGMLFAIRDQVAGGTGVDIDYRLINAANAMRRHENASNLSFFVFDLQRDPLALLSDLVPNGRVDVAFLLSICAWIENWKDVIYSLWQLSEELVFESNGTEKQQTAQMAYLATLYSEIDLLSATSTDDESAQRSLYLCRGKVI
ncbi:class I SAM-dependent methyltransferase [Sphingopyxis indica]|uniref:class I SAM-dependent methyltransferase n=1 Tax=Sphingopyxis indica TaxID=436663 RepID=UPI002939301C|nr:methyltransferase domain-containing protein [Sphingopyxis indica]WOF44585.1 class I SAM-dependent methyltransferase [Sphingopyxis indica]